MRNPRREEGKKTQDALKQNRRGNQAPEQRDRGNHCSAVLTKNGVAVLAGAQIRRGESMVAGVCVVKCVYGRLAEVQGIM